MRGDKIAEKIIRNLKIYKISLKYFYRDIQLLQFIIIENEIVDDYISYKIDNKQRRGRDENDIKTNI